MKVINFIFLLISIIAFINCAFFDTLFGKELITPTNVPTAEPTTAITTLTICNGRNYPIGYVQWGNYSFNCDVFVPPDWAICPEPQHGIESGCSTREVNPGSYPIAFYECIARFLTEENITVAEGEQKVFELTDFTPIVHN